jgi:branched-chain amino acid transport system substrate-binding protein
MGSLVACGSSSSGGSASPSGDNGSDNPFVVLAVVSKTGALSVPGAGEIAALNAAAKYVNANGGIGGRQIKIETLNDDSVPATAVSVLLGYLGSHDAPDLIYPGTNSSDFKALLPILEKRNLLAMAEADGGLLASAEKYQRVFTVSPSISVQLDSVVSYLKDQGYKNVGLFQSETAFAEFQTPVLKEALGKAGIKTSVITFDNASLDLTPELSRLKAKKPDVVYMMAQGAANGVALKNRAALKWDVPFVLDPSGSTLDLTTLVDSSALRGVRGTFSKIGVYQAPEDQPAGLQAMLNGLKESGEKINQGLLTYGLAWDGIMAVRHAAAQAGSTEPEAIAAALNDLTETTDPAYVTFTNIQFSPTNHENIGAAETDYVVAPVGPQVDGMVKPAE